MVFRLISHQEQGFFEHVLGTSQGQGPKVFNAIPIFLSLWVIRKQSPLLTTALFLLPNPSKSDHGVLFLPNCCDEDDTDCDGLMLPPGQIS